MALVQLSNMDNIANGIWRDTDMSKQIKFMV